VLREMLTLRRDRSKLRGMDTRSLDLSPEQRQVVALIAEGMDTEDIAEAMFISRDVVKRKIRRIREKVGGDRMTDLPALVAAAEKG